MLTYNKVVLENTFIVASVYKQSQRSPPLPPNTFIIKEITCTHTLLTHLAVGNAISIHTWLCMYISLHPPSTLQQVMHSLFTTHLAICSASSKHSGGKGSPRHTAEVKGEHGLSAWNKEREYCKQEGGGSLCVLCMPWGRNRIGMLIYVRAFVYKHAYWLTNLVTKWV